MTIVSHFLILLASVGLIVQPALGQEPSTNDHEKIVVFQFSIKEDIMPPAERKFNQAMDQADSLDADFILLTLDTYGGAVNVADNIRTRLLDTEARTIVFIENNAASAGALISLSCDSIFMRKNATMGAAMVVNQTGSAADEKYQSYFREKFRATAEAKGRDADIAEAMVNPDVHIPGVIDSGKILTFTAERALEFNFCNKILNDEAEVLRYMALDEATTASYELTFVDRIVRFFTNPMVNSILITVIFFGIFFELQSPGIGFPFVAALIAAVLFFTPHYLDGLAENWEILLFIIGLGLIAVEIFVIPGFGIAGISGIAFALGGLVLSMVQNVRFDFTFVEISELSRAMVVVVGSVLITGVLLFIFAKNFYRSPLFGMLIFKDTQQAAEGYTTNTFAVNDPTGKEGIAVTDLHPSGVVEIGDERFDAFTNGEYIEKNAKIVVRKARGFSVVVEELKA